MANIVDNFRRNASNFIYAFISDDAAKAVFGQSPVILQKRKNQIAYITAAAKMSKYSYQQLKDIIADQIEKDYGKPAGAVLLDLCEGKNVYSNKQIAVGRSASFIGAAIDQSTGYPKGKDTNRYTAVSDSESTNPIGVFDLESGKQVSYYDQKANKWRAGATPTSDKNSRNLWTNNINWNNIILAIISMIGSIFGVRQARNVASYQSDGWYGVTQNTTQTTSVNNLFPIALLCVVGYMLVTNNEQ